MILSCLVHSGTAVKKSAKKDAPNKGLEPLTLRYLTTSDALPTELTGPMY